MSLLNLFKRKPAPIPIAFYSIIWDNSIQKVPSESFDDFLEFVFDIITRNNEQPVAIDTPVYGVLSWDLDLFDRYYFRREFSAKELVRRLRDNEF